MANLIYVTKQWAKENIDFIFYNYLAEKKIITIEQCQKDLVEKYDINLSIKSLKDLFLQSVRNGILKQNFRSYEFVLS